MSVADFSNRPVVHLRTDKLHPPILSESKEGIQVINCYQEYDWRTRRTYLDPEHTQWVMNVGDTFNYDPVRDGDES